jgi:hypothetical protein
LIMTCVSIGIVQSIAYRQMKDKEENEESTNEFAIP